MRDVYQKLETLAQQRGVSAETFLESLLEQRPLFDHAILESITDGFYALDHYFNYLYINQSAEKLIQKPRTDLIGRNLWTVFPEMVGSLFDQNFRRALDEKKPLSFVAYYPPFQSWFEINLYPAEYGLSVYFRNINERKRLEETLLRSHEELETHVIGRTLDLTEANKRLQTEIDERRQTEAALRASEARFAGILDLATNAIISTDSVFRITLFNKGAERIFGYPAAEVLGLPIDRLIPERFHPSHSHHLDQFEQAVESSLDMHQRNEIYGLRKDGSEFPCEASIAKLIIGDERVYTVFLRDISERRETERAMQRFSVILEATSDLVLIIDKQQRGMYLNRAGRRALEIPETIPTPRLSLRQVVTGECYRLLTQTALDQALDEGLWAGEIEMLTRIGRIFPASVVLQAHRDQHGEIEYFSLLIRDISERKQIEEDLRANLLRERELNELKSRFVSMVSHEFRTPMSVILSSSEMLRLYGDRMDDPRRLEHLNKIKAHIQHLSRLVESVLTLSKTQSVTLGFNPERVHIRALCTEMIDEIQAIVQSNHKIFFVSDAHCDTVLLDRHLMQLMLSNLLSNAIKYSPNHQEISLYLQCESDQIILKVSDQGIGIPQKDLARLFEPFYRAQNVGMISGTGLGLAIALQTVQAHHGTIEVESQEGVGTTFTIRLPTRIA
ncbi:MAG: PAS domain S-box protein [Anaerolineae bacterium]|nr:PAS domain S-box protein [Anaerolineae bacterium]